MKIHFRALEQKKRRKQIMNIIDMHCDTLDQIRVRRIKGEEVTLRQDDRLCVTLEKMKQSGYLLQNFAAFVELKRARSQYGSDGAYQIARELMAIFKEEMAANQDRIHAVTSFAELAENERQGRMSALLTIEEGGTCCGDLGKLREFYTDGVRMMTLTWNYENEIGYPAAVQGPSDREYQANENRAFGLKETGIQFVEEMEQLGIIVDVSHLSDDGFFDVFEHTRKPFVASHSNARALCGHQRNLTDTMLRMLGERGGVTGLNLCPDFVIAHADAAGRRAQDGKNLLDYLACHAVHMMDVGGSACVGLGTDFDGFDEEGQPKDASFMQDLAWALHRQHVSDDRIDDIMYRNVYRLYRELL